MSKQRHELTLGRVEHFNIQVGDVSFKLHAHVVEHAPFRLFLGRSAIRKSE